MPTQTTLSRVESFPFDSRADGYDEDGYPVYDRAVGAGLLRATFAKFFSDGVFPSPGTALQISKGSGLTVTIQPGIFIINGAMGGYLTDAHSLTLDTAAPQGNVAYGIMLRYDENEQYRSCYIRVVRGEAAGAPTPPAPDQSTPGVMEYRLGYVTVPSGATDLTGATVTNEKGLKFCPYAAPFEDLDLSQVIADAKAQAQEATDAFLTYAQTYYDLVASALDGTTAGELQEQIDEITPANFVDNTSLSLTSDGKMQVKDFGVTASKLATKAVTAEKMADDAVMFTDDASSEGNAESRTAATPAFVRNFMATATDYNYTFQGEQSGSLTYFNFEQSGYEVNGFTVDGAKLKCDRSLNAFISYTFRGNNNGWVAIKINGETIYTMSLGTASAAARTLSAVVHLDPGDYLEITYANYYVSSDLLIVTGV